MTLELEITLEVLQKIYLLIILIAIEAGNNIHSTVFSLNSLHSLHISLFLFVIFILKTPNFCNVNNIVSLKHRFA